MNIYDLVIRHYTEVEANAELRNLYDDLRKYNALVIKENEGFAGLLTLYDIAVNPQRYAVDAALEKPFINENDDIQVAADIIEDYPFEAFPVTDDEDHFKGILLKKDVVGAFRTLLESQRHKVQYIAHDLKGTVANLQLLGKLLTDSNEANSEGKILKHFNTSCESISELVEDLVDSGDKERSELHKNSKLIDLKKILNTINDEYNAQVQSKSLVVNLDVPAGPVKINGDPLRLKRIFRNLLSNAIKYTPSGKAIDIALKTSGQYANIEVRDQGIGIPEDLQDKLFTEYSGINRPGLRGESSSGLGLFIAKRYAKLHGGDIKVHSTENEGTEMIVELPLPEKVSNNDKKKEVHESS